ncbi:MAG: hypothetical protein IPN53_06120 [Comamonadaceae bacterium]|nr:hypothetical protein [Comamonadaceae bacterium]
MNMKCPTCGVADLTHYARSRISRVLKDYFGTLSDTTFLSAFGALVPCAETGASPTYLE